MCNDVTFVRKCVGMGPSHLEYDGLDMTNTDDSPPLAHLDGGSGATTTDRKSYLWHYRVYMGDPVTGVNIRFKDAGGRSHRPVGIGMLCVPTTTGTQLIECYYTPTLPCTIMSPAHVSRSLSLLGGYGIQAYDQPPQLLLLKHRSDPSKSVAFPLTMHGDHTWTQGLILPNMDERSRPSDVAIPCPSRVPRDEYFVRHLSSGAERVLWHQRLGHIHHRCVANLHKTAIGVPKLDLGTIMDQCPICLETKAHRPVVPLSHSKASRWILDSSSKRPPTRNGTITTKDSTVPITCDHETFGLTLFRCDHRHRVAIQSIVPRTSASTIRNAAKKYTGAFLVEINVAPVFTVEDALAAFARARADTTTTVLELVLSPERKPAMKQLMEPYVFGIDQLRSIAPLIYPDIAPDLSDLTDHTLDCMVHSLASLSLSPSQSPSPDPVPTTSATVTPAPLSTALPAEIDGGKLTRRKLKTLSTWPLWQKAEWLQLDNMERQQMYGVACLLPLGAILLRQIWTYIFKPDGKRKARNCCDGSPRAAPQLRSAAKTYASCIESPCQRMFFSLASACLMWVLLGDATNAFANSPPPSTPTFVRLDAQYLEWFEAKYSVKLPPHMVLPVLHALQGHPEAPALWEAMINKILKLIGFTSTTHERNLYCATINGHKVLLCRQVDDLAVACCDLDTARWVLTEIGKHVTLTFTGEPLTKFNGVDIHQTSTYIEVSCTSYVRRTFVVSSRPTVGPLGNQMKPSPPTRSAFLLPWSAKLRHPPTDLPNTHPMLLPCPRPTASRTVKFWVNLCTHIPLVDPTSAMP